MRISPSRSGGAVIVRAASTHIASAAGGDARCGLLEVLFMGRLILGALVGSLKAEGRVGLSIAGAPPAVRAVLRMARVDRSIGVLPFLAL